MRSFACHKEDDVPYIENMFEIMTNVIRRLNQYYDNDVLEVTITIRNGDDKQLVVTADGMTHCGYTFLKTQTVAAGNLDGLWQDLPDHAEG